MTEEMKIEDYLAQGGKLTSPGNVPSRYRAELLKLMATFVDSELAGAAGFADTINDAPGIKPRIAAAKIVAEKTDNAGKVLRLMGDFGADTNRYATHHPWAARLDRDADIGTQRSEHDMRLAVFNYPLNGWVDSVVMNLLMGEAVGVQLDDMTKLSYQPLAEAFREIKPVEQRHTELAAEGLAEMDDMADAQASVDYWWPRVASSFGGADTARDETLRNWGLRHGSSADMRSAWETRAAKALDAAGLSKPA
ncbi:MAG: phenylacetic acid catabolic [Rhodobacterales bacterium]|nr:MAG: phenylacetic acid catabolic [Rhodobacterales bacterium]